MLLISPQVTLLVFSTGFSILLSTLSQLLRKEFCAHHCAGRGSIASAPSVCAQGLYSALGACLATFSWTEEPCHELAAGGHLTPWKCHLHLQTSQSAHVFFFFFLQQLLQGSAQPFSGYSHRLFLFSEKCFTIDDVKPTFCLVCFTNPQCAMLVTQHWAELNKSLLHLHHQTSGALVISVWLSTKPSVSTINNSQSN